MKDQKKSVFTIVVMMVLFSLLAVNNVSAADNWTEDYQFGYQEGLRYAQMENFHGYTYMYNHYIEMRELYGDDNINYTARIEGLKDGWIDGLDIIHLPKPGDLPPLPANPSDE